jgi:hypothetical protein
MDEKCAVAGTEYTKEELIVLARLRGRSGRTCRDCKWFRPKGKHRGCFPEEKYRKWLSEEEFNAGCELFSPAEEK